MTAVSALLLCMTLSGGCVHRGAFTDQPVVDIAQQSIPTPASSVADVDDSFAPELIFKTVSRALGTPYTRGGSNLSGFDCSGFVQWTYKHVGISLPRTAREQSTFGTPVPRDEMQVGDIVAFRHPRRGYHTGIYVGNNNFIHSPRQRESVRVTSMDDEYFSRTFLGARRVLPVMDEEALAEMSSTSNLLALADTTAVTDASVKATKTSGKKSSVKKSKGKFGGKSDRSVSSATSRSQKTTVASRSIKDNKSATADTVRSKANRASAKEASKASKVSKVTSSSSKSSSKASKASAAKSSGTKVTATVAKNDTSKSVTSGKSRTSQKSSQKSSGSSQKSSTKKR